jgi:hypothetical protein
MHAKVIRVQEAREVPGGAVAGRYVDQMISAIGELQGLEESEWQNKQNLFA